MFSLNCFDLKNILETLQTDDKSIDSGLVPKQISFLESTERYHLVRECAKALWEVSVLKKIIPEEKTNVPTNQRYILDSEQFSLGLRS